MCPDKKMMKKVDKERMDQLIREAVMFDMEKELEEIENDPEMQQYEVPADLYDKIMKRIEEDKKQGGEEKSPWLKEREPDLTLEEEREMRQMESGDTEFAAEFLTAENMDILRAVREGRITVEDITAYRENKEKEAQKARKRKKRVVWRNIVAVALVAVMFFAFGMTGIGNKNYVYDQIKFIVEDRLNFKLNNTEVLPVDDSWTAVYDEIKEKLGINSVKFSYMPAGMEYKYVTINEDDRNAIICFEIEGKNLFVEEYADFKPTVTGVNGDGKIIDEVAVNSLDQIINVWEIGESEDKRGYVACINMENVCYILQGRVEKEEFIKIIENIYI